MAGRQPPIPEGWVYDSPWDNVVVEGDGTPTESIWGPVVQGLNTFGTDLMEGSTVNPYTWPGWLVGATLEGLTGAPNKYLQGEDVTLADAAITGAEAVPGIWGLGKAAVKGAQKVMGNLALPLDITRMMHAHDTQRLTAKQKALAEKNRKNSTATDRILEATVPLYRSVNPHERRGWYRGGKPYEMALMAKNSIVEPIKRLYDPWADHLYRKYGISDSQRAEFERAFKWEDGYYDASGNLVKNPRQPTNKNEYISNAQYIETVLEKYFPGNHKFHHEMRQLLMPRTIRTTGADMAESAIPIREVLGITLGDSDDILTHISRPIVGKHKLGGKEVILNSRKWSEDSPIKTMHTKSGTRDRVKQGERKFHGASGKYNPAVTAHYVMKGMPEGPVTLDDIISTIRQSNDEVRSAAIKIKDDAYASTLTKDGKRKKNFKRIFNNKVDQGLRTLYTNQPLIKIDELYDGMEETQRFISFDGRILGEDRLLANYNHRLIIDKTNGDMYILTFDEMRLGSGNATLDTIVNAGSPESIMVDITPVLRKPGNKTTAGESVATKQLDLDKQEWAAQIRKGMEAMMDETSYYNYNPLENLGDTAKFIGKTTAVHAGAYELLDED